MELPEPITRSLGRARRAIDPVVRFAQLERVIAGICFVAPFLLIVFDSWNIQESISDYYDMAENQWFYFLLTVLAMLFVVNGVIKDGHWYNTLLGLAVAGVVLFNKDDVTWLHFTFAAGFFVGNGLVVLFSSGMSTRAKWIFALGIGLPMVANWIFDVVTLFWAEWVSFAVIAVHYIADTIEKIPGTKVRVPYEAIKPRSVRQAQ